MYVYKYIEALNVCRDNVYYVTLTTMVGVPYTFYGKSWLCFIVMCIHAMVEALKIQIIAEISLQKCI